LTQAQAPDAMAALDRAPVSKFHLRAALVSGMGFFTDAYDLFVIGIASALIKLDWNLTTGQLALLNATMLGAAFLGALVFGRVADLIGRKRVYWLVAAIMAVAAIGSAFAPSLPVLIGFRFLLGLGVGGDYPVSAVLMSEYSNARRGSRRRCWGKTSDRATLRSPTWATACRGSCQAAASRRRVAASGCASSSATAGWC
jgi:MFS family permease